MVQNAGSGVSDVQKDAEQRTMLRVALHALPQGFGIFERSERPVDSAEHFTERNILGWPLELVAAIGAAQADHDPGALEFEENGFEELLRQMLLRGDIPNLDNTLRVTLGQDRQRLQSVESSLGNSHHPPQDFRIKL